MSGAPGTTAGEWFIVPYGDGDSLVIHSDAQNRVCFMATPGERGSLKTIYANAHQIVASSAMYDALEKTMDVIFEQRSTLFECHTVRCDPSTLEDEAKPEIERLDSVIAEIAAALAAARGENV